MYKYNIGDVVVRKSYSGDIYFRVADIIEKDNGGPTYILKGLFYRIEADSDGGDLVKQDVSIAYQNIRMDIRTAKNRMYRNITVASRIRTSPLLRSIIKPGKILHIDGDSEFLNMCLGHYKEYGIPAVGKTVKESEQPRAVRKYLETYQPNILVLTGHDSYKKNSDKNDIKNYSNSKYFIDSAKAARTYEPNPSKLCVFSGACQSYYERIMNAGANFASSPGRIMINALDPSFVAQQISLAEAGTIVTPEKAIALTVSGKKGIWGINTKGQLKTRHLLRYFPFNT